MIGEKTVLGTATRPAGGVQTQQADKTPGRCGQFAGRHPADRDARVEPVVLPESIQGAVQRCGCAGTQRLAPDVARPAAQQPFAGLLCACDTPVQQADDEAKRGAVIQPVRPVGRRQTLNQARPRCAGRERRVGRQDAGPTLRQGLHGAGIGSQQRVQPPHPRLREPAHQDVRERRCRLPLSGSRHLDSVHEMHVEIGIRAQRQEMVVVVGQRGAGDGDIGRLGLAGSQQLPRPAHGLYRFVIGGCSTDDEKTGGAACALLDVNCPAVKPLGYRPRARDPAHRQPRGHRVQQRPPDG